MATYERASQDMGNVVSLDHLNLTITDQQTATLFYVVGLGFTRDPYLTVGLENMWLNLGRQQLHLPTRPEAQTVRGRIGLVVPDLEELDARLGSVEPGLAGTSFAHSRGKDSIDVTGPWGNRFRCAAPGGAFGGTLMGMPYVEFDVAPGTAAGIARFYETVLGASVSVAPPEARGDGVGGACSVQVGRGQSLRFRETEEKLPAYDGHHLAVYLADFSSPHAALGGRGLVTEESNEHQYRFVDIVDPESGEVLHQLEHEVRSMYHPMFGRPLVNRDPSLTQRNYRRGADALAIG
ncbi:MAG: hypothetical protein IIC95_09670 [Chloroflexi bacterium]|nr:hypothetical protein [Chloroflexota bacterium]